MMKQRYSLDTKEREEEHLSCSSGNVGLCGPLAIEKERYAKLEDQLKNLSEESDSNAYRKYFLTLFNNFQTSMQFSSLIDIIKIDLSEIKAVESAYFFKRGNTIALWVFFERRDWKAEDKVYDTYDRILTIFPKFDVTLKILRLNGRKPEELLSVGGVKLIGV